VLLQAVAIFDDIPVLQDLSDDAQNVMARLLLLALTLILILFLRRTLTWAMVKPLRRVTGRTENNRDEEVLDAVMLPMRYFVIAAALLISVRILNTGDALTEVVSALGRTFIIVGIAVLLYRLVGVFAPSSNRLFSITGLTIQDRLLPFIRTAVKIFIIVLALLIIVQEWGYDANGLIAGLGIGGLAISLAAQDSLANLFGFVAIVGDRPFDVGEYIVFPDGDGIVEHVGIRSTRVRRLDQALITVPNRKLADNAILNWSTLSKRRIDFVLGVTYSTDSSQMRVLLHQIREMLKSRPAVDPESVVVYFINFGDSSLDILVRAYVLIQDWGEFTAEREQVNLEVMDIVAQLGLSVAFPSRSLYLETMPDMLTDMLVSRIASERGMVQGGKEDIKLPPEEIKRLEAEAREAEEKGTHSTGDTEQDLPDDVK
jgi:MscS family membrane protein